MSTPIKRLVDHFGDQVKTAKALCVSQPAVSQWLSGACGMSAAKAFVAEEKSDGAVKAWELCDQIPRPEESSAQSAA